MEDKLSQWALKRLRAAEKITFGGPPPDPNESLFRPPDDFAGEDSANHLIVPAPGEMPKQDHERVRGIFRQAFSQKYLTLQDLLPFRIILVYRITRHLLRARGMITDSQSVAEALAPTKHNSNPWACPIPVKDHKVNYTVSFSAKDIIQEYRSAEHLPTDLQTMFDGMSYPGMAFLPPTVPLQWYSRETGDIDINYNPQEDPLLRNFLYVVQLVAQDLALEAGSEKARHLGSYGLFGLDDPLLIRIAWPSPSQIIAWEQILVEQSLDVLAEDGLMEARGELSSKLAFNRHETNAIMALAKDFAQGLVTTNLEQSRAIMLLRLEKLALRAKEAFNLREEMNAIKQASVLLGLSKQEPEDFNFAFRKLVENTAMNRKEQLPGIEQSHLRLENTDDEE